MRATSKVRARVVTLAVTGGLVLGASGIANAAYNPASPPYNGAATGGPDANNVASLTIYNLNGGVVTGGANATSLNNYYFVASSNFVPGQNKAALSGFLAEAGKNPDGFSGTGLGTATTYPIATAPSNISGSPNPTARGGSSSSFASLAGAYPNTAASSSDFYQLYQLRVLTTAPTSGDSRYAYADIKIDTASGTWTQVGPTPGTAAPAAPAKPTVQTGNATGAADVTVPSVPGATSYKVTANPGGATCTTPAGSSTCTLTGLTNDTSYTATAVALNAGGPSLTSAASDPFVPSAPLPSTVTSLATSNVSGADTETVITLTSTTKYPDASGTAVPQGNVTFTDSVDGVLGTFPTDANGQATLSRKFSASPSHSVTASYVDSATPAQYKSSTSQPTTFAVASYVDPNGACANTASQCTDDQYFKAVVAQGTLVISTPYVDTQSAFDLGTLQLNDQGTMLSSGPKAFGDATGTGSVPTSPKTSTYPGVTISDRRSGDLPWTAKVIAGNFTADGNPASACKIDAQNLGFTGVTPNYIPGNALSASTVQPDGTVHTVGVEDHAAAAPAVACGAAGNAGLKSAQRFAYAAHGNGSVFISGNMTLNAPTSTPAGTYYAKVTFTIS